jgi:hypothetical protein
MLKLITKPTTKIVAENFVWNTLLYLHTLKCHRYFMLQRSLGYENNQILLCLISFKLFPWI